jgi:hypothetical protein
MSDTSRVQLAYIAEDTFGTAQSGSHLQTLRYTGESLRQTHTVVRSNEIRADRQVPSVRRSRVEAAGSINGELSYGTWDDFLLAALQASTWAAGVTVGPLTTLAAVASGNKITDSGAGLAGLTAGAWISVSGFSTAANNGFFKISSVAAGEIVLTGGTLADEVAGASVTIVQGGAIANGTTLTSYNLEKTFADLTNELALLLGMAPSGLTLTVPQDGVITVAFDFMGVCEESLAASGGSGYDAAPTTPVMTSRDVTNLLEDQAAMGITGFSLRLNNNLRTRLECGATGVTGLGAGTIDLTGTLQAYYTSKTLYDKYLDDTASKLALALTDPAGNQYVLDLPQVKFSGGQRVAGGPNGDVLADMQWEAYLGAGASMLTITRWPAA